MRDRPSSLSIVSLIPSATEIVAALGLSDSITGRSHECDFPANVRDRPVCTQPKFDPAGSSADVHNRVTQLLESALSVYRVDPDILRTIRPTHILTQAQCEVCAVSLGDVETAVSHWTGTRPRIVSLEPRTLADLWDDIRQVAASLGVDGEPLILYLKQRIHSCIQPLKDLSVSDRPSVACIEWIDPLMAAGNWIPELVELAGGRSCFGVPGEHSPWITWDDLIAADPDILIAMPCGYDLVKTREEIQTFLHHPLSASLRAIQKGRLYITDGNQYFNRPGPRLVDSLEVLAEILHPDKAHYGFEGTGWVKLLP